MINEILDVFDDEEFLKADGFDDAIIGVETKTMRLIYSESKCIDILLSQGLSEIEAIEEFDFNVKGAFVGDKPPIWCFDM